MTRNSSASRHVHSSCGRRQRRAGDVAWVGGRTSCRSSGSAGPQPPIATAAWLPASLLPQHSADLTSMLSGGPLPPKPLTSMAYVSHLWRATWQ